MFIEKYRTIILDFDGVTANSNYIKLKSIKKVMQNYLENKELQEFTNFFTHNNGIPRKIKIKKFIKDEIKINTILKSYKKILENEKIPLTDNFRLFMNLLDKYLIKVHILSGGEREEIVKILEEHNISSFFSSIMCSPLTKDENVELHNIKYPTLYIGDSIVDYNLSIKYNFDFIFMYQYSQFKNWKSFFKDKNVKIIKNLGDLC